MTFCQRLRGFKAFRNPSPTSSRAKAVPTMHSPGGTQAQGRVVSVTSSMAFWVRLPQVGPQATNTFYQRIIDRTQADTDQEHLRVLIWSDAKIPDRTAGILGTPEQAEAVFAHLLADAKLLEGAGCTVLAIPCNTSHYFADRLQAQLHVPIIHMIRETVKTIQAMGKQTVGILATDGTVQTGIYQNELTAAGLTPVTLPEELQKTVMSIIYDEIKKGETGSREKFGEIDAYLRSVGCDCAILGCTELSVYRTSTACPPSISTPWRSWPSRPSSAAANNCGTYKKEPSPRGKVAAKQTDEGYLTLLSRRVLR